MKISPDGIRSFFNSWSGLATVIALFATLYLGLRSAEPRLELLVSRPSVEVLGRSIPGTAIEASFRLKGQGRVLEELYFVRGQAQNVGPRSIVGHGQRTSLVGPCISIVVSEAFSVIQAELANPPSGFKLSTAQNRLCLAFDQWLAGEKIELFVYLEKINKQSTEQPEIAFVERDIINGYVRKESPRDDLTRVYPMFRFLPSTLIVAMVGLAALVIGLLVIGAIGSTIEGFYKTRRHRKWMSSHGEQFKAELSKRLGALSAEEIKAISGKWSSLPASVGENIEPKPPSWEENDQTIGEALAVLGLAIALAVALIVLVYPLPKF